MGNGLCLRRVLKENHDYSYLPADDKLLDQRRTADGRRLAQQFETVAYYIKSVPDKPQVMFVQADQIDGVLTLADGTVFRKMTLKR